MRVQSGVSRPEKRPPFLLALAVGGSMGGRILPLIMWPAGCGQKLESQVWKKSIWYGVTSTIPFLIIWKTTIKNKLCHFSASTNTITTTTWTNFSKRSLGSVMTAEREMLGKHHFQESMGWRREPRLRMGKSSLQSPGLNHC
jgi:hypothetical protein